MGESRKVNLKKENGRKAGKQGDRGSRKKKGEDWRGIAAAAKP